MIIGFIVLMIILVIIYIIFLVRKQAKKENSHLKKGQSWHTIPLTPQSMRELGIPLKSKSISNESFLIKNSDGSIFFEYSKDKTPYYLADTDFTPKFDVTDKISGRTGRALIGGLLFGPVGAVVGASGSKKIKHKAKEKEAIAYMHLINTDFDGECVVSIKAKQILVNLINKEFKISKESLQKRYEDLYGKQEEN